MGLRFASLGSGSDGNGLVVEAGRTRVLIDCGFTLAEATRRLERLGLAPESISAVVVTHEHADHVSGVARLATKYSLPVWASFGTLTAMCERFADIAQLCGVNGDESFAIGDLQFEPLPVPHDAREPVQYVVSEGALRLAVLTDLGEVTAHIVERVSGCDALVLECNHEPDLLAKSDYPYALKNRIAGRFGHLDNAAAAALLARIDRSRLKHVIAAHLSQQNNRPELAQAALAGALGCAPEWVAVADAERGFDWRNV